MEHDSKENAAQSGAPSSAGSDPDVIAEAKDWRATFLAPIAIFPVVGVVSFVWVSSEGAYAKELMAAPILSLLLTVFTYPLLSMPWALVWPPMRRKGWTSLPQIVIVAIAIALMTFSGAIAFFMDSSIPFRTIATCAVAMGGIFGVAFWKLRRGASS